MWVGHSVPNDPGFFQKVVHAHISFTGSGSSDRSSGTVKRMYWTLCNRQYCSALHSGINYVVLRWNLRVYADVVPMSQGADSRILHRKNPPHASFCIAFTDCMHRPTVYTNTCRPVSVHALRYFSDFRFVKSQKHQKRGSFLTYNVV